MTGFRQQRLRLPISIQTFRTIRESGCYYVDKTALIEQLVKGGTHYFLSRPRRFGKSLLLDTVKELFESSEDLFEGLAVHPRWDWSVSRPVVRIDFSGGLFTDPGGVRDAVRAQLFGIERREGLANDYADLSEPGRLALLLEELHRRSGRRVVVLVDEYDKPILDAILHSDLARENRDFLRGLYGCLKSADAHVRFVMLTGVSKFSKVSLFSGLNNLIDITLRPEYSPICGFTEADIDGVFAAELEGLDRGRVREWYNGYSWCGEERVYNPYDILLLCHERRFKAHWFETGTPKFLVDTLIARGVPTPSLTQPADEGELMSSFDVEHIGTEALLFQTGHLTITGVNDDGDGEVSYDLDYPNREVRQSLNKALLKRLVDIPTAKKAKKAPLLRLLNTGDTEGLHDRLHAFYASIPYEWHTNNDITRFEGYYASVFYSYFAASGLDVVVVEDSTSLGRVDMAVRCTGHTYVFEFKIAETSTPGVAMAQLQGYADKYRSPGTTVHLVAVGFSRQARNIVLFETTTA